MTAVIKLKRGTSTPTTSNIVNGEVAVDTSAKKLYVNDSGTIKEIGGGTSGIASLAADSSPELAATLDCNNNNLTEVGTVSGDNLQIDFGTL